jgi:Leucine-rich repeat (LRR) protein
MHFGNLSCKIVVSVQLIMQFLLPTLCFVFFLGMTGCDDNSKLKSLDDRYGEKVRIGWLDGEPCSVDASNKSWHELKGLLRGRESVVSLYIWHCDLEVEDFRIIASLSKLKKLSIVGGHERIDPDGITLLSSLKNLETLKFRAENTNSTIFQSLEGFSSLKILDLSGNRIMSLEGLAKLDLPKLEILDISSNPIDEIGFGYVTQMKNLTGLHAHETNISVEGCKLPKTLYKLRSYTFPSFTQGEDREIKRAFDEERVRAKEQGIEILPESEYPFQYYKEEPK